MSLSEELKSIYVNNPIAVRAIEVIELHHYLFTGTIYLVANPEVLLLESSDGTTQSFLPASFTVTTPTKGSNQQDLQLVIGDVGGRAITELERAVEDINTPIILKYASYLEGNPRPQSDILTLELANVSATSTTITTTAVRTDLFGIKVPARNYDAWIFKGVA